MFWRSNSRGLIRACVYCAMLNCPASWDCMTVIFKSFRSRFWNGGEWRIDTEQEYILLALVCWEKLKVKTQDLLECRIAETLIITLIDCISMLGLNDNNLNGVFKLQTKNKMFSHKDFVVPTWMKSRASESTSSRSFCIVCDLSIIWIISLSFEA